MIRTAVARESEYFSVKPYRYKTTFPAPTNLGVRGSNPFGRAIYVQNHELFPQRFAGLR